jgi:hypothetical protein
VRGGEHHRRAERGIEQRTFGGDATARVEQHTQRRDARRVGDAAHGELRPVGEGGAGPDNDGLRIGAQLVDVGARGLGGDPLRRAVGGGATRVERRRVLHHHVGAAGAPVMQIRRELRLDLARAHADRDVDTDVAQPRDAPSGDDRVGIADRDDHACDAGIAQRERARGGVALVVAGFERHIRGCAACPVARSGERSDFGV